MNNNRSMKLAPLALIALACNSLPPPPAITVRDNDDPIVVSAISVARDAWCNADVGWCPDLVSFGGAEVSIVPWDGVGGERIDGTWYGAAGHEDAWNIEVDPAFMTDEELPGILTHEFGHFCIEGHNAKSALMTWFHTEAIVPVVDEQARESWLDACVYN